MKVQKILAAFAAALMMLGISAPASAFDCEGNGNAYDPTTIANNLEAIAVELRCSPGTKANPGKWPADNPIWERRGAGSCNVHHRLAQKLLQNREFDENSKPRKNQANDAEGAAWKVRNEKYEDAIQKLDQLIVAILKSRLNRAFDPNVGAAQMLANELVAEVEEAKICVAQLLP